MTTESLGYGAGLDAPDAVHPSGAAPPTASRLAIAVRAGSIGLRCLVDAAIGVYLASLAVVLLLDGADLGVVRATTGAKPLLALALLVPVRIAAWGRPSPWVSSAIVRRIHSHGWRGPGPAVMDVLATLPGVAIVSTLIGYIAFALLPSARPPAFTAPGPWPELGQTLAVWDSGWYWDIALRGYSYHPDQASSIAFFPLYPLLMRLVAWPFGGGHEAVFWAGVLVSWASLAGALVLLHRFTAALTGDRLAARRTVVLILVFPFSFYFLRIYTESLFLLLSVASLFAAVRGRWTWAAVAGALATVTRPNGILIAVPLALMAVSGLPPWRDVLRRGALLTLLPLALAAYCLFCYDLTGDPLAWLDAQRHWHYAIDRLPYRHLLRTLSAIEQHGLLVELRRSGNAPVEFLYTIIALVFLGAVPFIWRRFGAGLALYVGVSLLIPLSGTTLEGIGRYASVLFPAFMLAGAVTTQEIHERLVVVSALLLTLCTILFVGWHPLQ